jgi:peptidoglycan/LPS O-acetylase OafA/YrhL
MGLLHPTLSDEDRSSVAGLGWVTNGEGVGTTLERAPRKAYLDGLRGAAACMVLLAHLSIALAIPLGPLRLIANGNFGVCIFFILSGYVLAGLAQNSTLSLSAQTIRRYLRLAIPILLTSSVAWALLALGAYHNKAAGEIIGSWWMGAWYQFEPSFTDMGRQALYGCFVGLQPIYNSNLWTMQPEFFGSFYVFLINAVSGNRILRAAFLLTWGGFDLTGYFPLFAAGALLFEFESDLRSFYAKVLYNSALKGLAISALVCVGLYLGGMPDFKPDQVLRSYAWLPRFASDNAMRWHQIAALASMVAVLLSPMLQSTFGSSLGRYLGRISFVMYLFQVPIICSYTAWVVVEFSTSGQPGWLVVTMAFVSTIAVIFLISSVTYRLIDENGVRLSRLVGRQFDSLFPARRQGPSSEQHRIMRVTGERTPA